MAITISVDQVHGVAGVIVPGDLVNILVMPRRDFCADTAVAATWRRRHRSDAGSARCAGAAPRSATRPAYLYQAAKVLFVDKTAVPAAG